MVADSESETITLTVEWPDETDDIPVVVANVFSLLGSEGEFFLTIGQVVPPVASGTMDEKRDALERLGRIAVRPVGRFGMTPKRLRELQKILTNIVDQLGPEQEEE